MNKSFLIIAGIVVLLIFSRRASATAADATITPEAPIAPAVLGTPVVPLGQPVPGGGIIVPMQPVLRPIEPVFGNGAPTKVVSDNGGWTPPWVRVQERLGLIQ